MAVLRREGLAIGIDLPEIARRCVRRIEGEAGEVLQQHELAERLKHRHFDNLAFARSQFVDVGPRARLARR